MKKAQNQVPLILIFVLALFIVYILWINPSDRAKILGLNDNAPSNNTGNTSSSIDRVVFTKNIGYVGRQTGNAVGTHSFGSLGISYPLVNESVVEKGSAVLTANVLLKGSTRISIPGEYSSVTVRARVGEVVGTPNLEIKSGNIVLFKSGISKNQNVDLEVEAAKIIGGSLEVSCQWRGLLFWQSQKCELLDFEVVKQYYSNVNPVETLDFSVTSGEARGSNYKLCFKVDDSSNLGALTAKINDAKIYSASPLARSASYCVKNSLSSADLTVGTNILELSAEAGGVYDLSNVSLTVFEESAEASNQTFYFSVPSNVYSKASSFTIEINVDSVIDEGGLDVVLGNVYYFLGPNDLVEGLNLIDVSKNEVMSGTNKMRVESSTGRFKIGDLRLVWE